MGQLLGSLLWVTLGAIGLMPPLIENLCPEAKGAKTKQKKKQKNPKKQTKGTCGSETVSSILKSCVNNILDTSLALQYKLVSTKAQRILVEVLWLLSD